MEKPVAEVTAEAEPAERLLTHEQLNLVLDEIFLDGKTDLEIDYPSHGVSRVFGVFNDNTSSYGREKAGNHYVGIARSKGLAPESEIYRVEAHPFDETKPSLLLEYHPRKHSVIIAEYIGDSEPVVTSGYHAGIKEMLDLASEIVEAQKGNRPEEAISQLDDVELKDIHFELQPLAA